jgi:hypothetical protein
VSVVSASEFRVPHVWAEADVALDPAKRVGGADFGQISLAHQRDLKKDVLRDALIRFGKVDPATVSLLLDKVHALPGDDKVGGLGWRTRVRLHTNDRGQVGPRARKSHDVIRVSSLPLATAGVNLIAPLSEEYGDVGSVDVLSPSMGDPRLIIGDQKPTVIRERVGDREFRVDDNGFWQVHHAAPVTLSAAVRAAIDPDRFDATAPDGSVETVRLGKRLSVTEVSSQATSYQQNTGRATQLTAWVSGKPRKDSTWRAINNQLVVEIEPSVDPATFTRASGASSSIRPGYAERFLILNYPDAVTALRALDLVRIAPGVVMAEPMLSVKRAKKFIPTDRQFSHATSNAADYNPQVRLWENVRSPIPSPASASVPYQWYLKNTGQNQPSPRTGGQSMPPVFFRRLRAGCCQVAIWAVLS